VGQVPVANVASQFLNQSKLTEFGIKWTPFGERLYAAVNYYEQENTSITPFTFENLGIRGEGWEAEIRAALADNLTITLSGTWADVFFNPQGTRFIFSTPEINGVDFRQIYGGSFGTVLPDDPRFAGRQGTPDQVLSANILYTLPGSGLGFSASVTNVSEARSGVAQSITLPEYTVVGLGAFWNGDNWTAQVNIDNATDELFFTSLFPEIYGDALVSPSVGRSWRLRLARRF
jgi:iron complex outermembrane receptor protein